MLFGSRDFCNIAVLLVCCSYLNYGITDFAESGIRSQDSSTVFSSVYDAGLVGAEYVLDFVEGNHERIYS